MVAILIWMVVVYADQAGGPPGPQQLLEQGKASMMELDFLSAATTFQTLIAQKPDRGLAAEAYLRLGYSLRAAGKVEEAMSAFETVVKDFQDRPREYSAACFELGRIALTQEDSENAVRWLALGDSAGPSPHDLRAAAELLSQTLSYEEIAEGYKKYCPDEDTVESRLGHYYVISCAQAGDVAGAISEAETWIDEGEPTAQTAALYAQMAAWYEQLKQPEEALDYYDLAIEVAEESEESFPWVYAQRGNYHRAHNEPDEAMADYQKAVNAAAWMGDDMVDVRLNLGDLYKNGARPEEAIGQYQLILKRVTPEVELWFQAKSQLGLTYKETGKIEEAITAFEELLDHAAVGRWVGRAAGVLEELYKQRDGTTGRATDLLEKYVREHPDTEGVREAKLRLGYFYDEQGNYDAAVVLGEKFLEEHPDRTAECARAQLRIAWAYEHSGRYEEARVAFEKVIQHYADQPQPVAIAKGDLAFVVLAREGKLHEAIILTEEAMEALASSDPAYITFQYRLATFYEQLGEYQEALQQYTRVPEGRASDPHLDRNIGVMLGKARCLWALQEYEKAQAVLEQIMEKWPQEALKRGVVDALEEVRVTAERATKQ